jgi:hypothetical protein
MTFNAIRSPKTGGRSMNWRLIAALLTLCLLAKLAASSLDHPRRHGLSARHTGLTNITSRSRLQYLREEWLGDARTAVAAFKYLLQADPPETDDFNVLVASNASGKHLSGPRLSPPAAPLPARSNQMPPGAGVSGPPQPRPAPNTFLASVDDPGLSNDQTRIESLTIGQWRPVWWPRCWPPSARETQPGVQQ